MIHVWQEYCRNDVSFLVHHIKGFMMSVCLSASNIDLEYLTKMVSARFFHCRVPFVVNKYLERVNLRVCFFSNFCPLILVSSCRTFKRFWFCLSKLAYKLDLIHLSFDVNLLPWSFLTKWLK